MTRRSALLLDPGQDGARVLDGGAIRKLQRRQLRISRLRAQLLARPLAQEGDRAAMRGDYLVVLDSGGPEGFLHAAARMLPGAAIVAVANEEREILGHRFLRGVLGHWFLQVVHWQVGPEQNVAPLVIL